jgi:hypothetical protein
MEWTRQVAALRGWAFEKWYGALPQLPENVCFLAGYCRRRLIDKWLIGSDCRQISLPEGHNGDLRNQVPDLSETRGPCSSV